MARLLEEEDRRTTPARPLGRVARFGDLPRVARNLAPLLAFRVPILSGLPWTILLPNPDLRANLGAGQHTIQHKGGRMAAKMADRKDSR